MIDKCHKLNCSDNDQATTSGSTGQPGRWTPDWRRRRGSGEKSRADGGLLQEWV